MKKTCSLKHLGERELNQRSKERQFNQTEGVGFPLNSSKQHELQL